LERSLFQAPRYRLDHLATFVDTHGQRLSHLLEALISYRRGVRRFRIKYALAGFFFSLLCAAAGAFTMMTTSAFAGMTKPMLLGAGGVVGLAVLFLWMTLVLRYFASAFHRNCLKDLDQLTPLENQTRRDTWQAVHDLVYTYLKKTLGRFSLREVKQEFAAVRRVCEKGAREIREALNELSSISAKDEQKPTDDSAD